MAWIVTRHGKRGATYMVGWREPDGTKRYATFKRLAGARDHAAKVDRELRTHSYIGADRQRMPLNEFAATVLVSAELRKSTAYRYQNAWDNYVRDELGRRPMGTITADHVRKLFKDMDSVGVGAPTIAFVRRVLSKVFRVAHAEGVVSRNPVSTVPAPKSERRQIRILTIREIEALADAAGRVRYRLMILLAAYGGLRYGEVAALAPTDVDVLGRRVTVRRALSMDRGTPYLAEPKTAAGRRTVTIPGSLAQELGEYMGMLQPDAELLFASVTGKPISNLTWRRIWLGACKRAGFEEPFPRFHDLRHSAVALAIQHGAHPKQIQSRMGHASIAVTLDTYGHLFPSLDGELADALETERLAVSSRMSEEVATLRASNDR